MNELQVTFGGRSYTFQPGQTVLIGRLSDSGIVVSDPTVSRRHAQLTWGPGLALRESGPGSRLPAGSGSQASHREEAYRTVAGFPPGTGGAS